MSLQQSFGTMLIPSADPSMDLSAIHLQTLCDLAGGLPLDAEHDRLQAQGDAGCFVGLDLLAKSFEPLESSRIALSEDGLHRQKRYVVLPRCTMKKQVPIIINKSRKESAPWLE